MSVTLFARAVVRRSILLLAALQAIASPAVVRADDPQPDGRLPSVHVQERESVNVAWSDDAEPSVSAAAAELALRRVQRGFQLGRRGAFYSARIEFVSAVRMLTQALDAPIHGAPHAEALARGLRALQESDDFVPRGLDLETELDLPGIVAIHRTSILKGRSASELTSLIALRHYYTYAQQQLAAAVGHEPVGSMAFYGLARVESALGRQEPNRHPAASPKAITLHQASLLVDQHNYAAANELGVLLVRHGRLIEAQQVFQHSLDAAPTRAAWQNLAALHRKLGQPELAAIADERARALAAGPAGRGARGAGDGSSPVEWLDAAQFARSRPGNDPFGREGRQPDRSAGPVASDRPPATSTPRQTRLFGWLPWSRSADSQPDAAARR